VRAAVQEAVRQAKPTTIRGPHRNKTCIAAFRYQLFIDQSQRTEILCQPQSHGLNSAVWPSIITCTDADAAPRRSCSRCTIARAGVHDAGEFPIHNDGLGWDGLSCQVNESGSQKTVPPVHL